MDAENNTIIIGEGDDFALYRFNLITGVTKMIIIFIFFRLFVIELVVDLSEKYITCLSKSTWATIVYFVCIYTFCFL